MSRVYLNGPFNAQDKHGIPDPITYGVRTAAIIDFGIYCGEYQFSLITDRAPSGVIIQWDPPPVDPYPDDGREYRRCVSGFHHGSQWVPAHLMLRRGAGYGSYCLDCERKRAKLRRRGLTK